MKRSLSLSRMPLTSAFASMPNVLIMGSRIYFICSSTERTLMSNSNKHELLIINLATVPAERNSDSMPNCVPLAAIKTGYTNSNLTFR